MLERLQKKWRVGGVQLLLIICTFAIGGSLTGYAGKKIMNLFALEKGATWIIIYILLVTILWPFAVLIVSVFFGQYPFFISYLRKMGERMTMVKARSIPALSSTPDAGNGVTRIAIFASGAGSNAQKIIDRLEKYKSGKTERITRYQGSNDQLPFAEVALIVCNKPGAGVLQIAADHKIPTLLIDKQRFFHGDGYIAELKAAQIDFIVLAGFLWKVPDTLITAYNGRIVNIHPALLPKYGGKGMYGHFVHAAVIAAGEKESGITIHYVDGRYDNGAVIFQASCPVLPGDTADTLAARIHELEHEHYPAVIEQLLLKK